MQVAEMLTASRQQAWLADTPSAHAVFGAGGHDFARVAFDALDAYRHDCSGLSSNCGWAAAEHALFGMGRPNGTYRICGHDWSGAARTCAGDSSRPVILPVISALTNTPIVATYGLDKTQTGDRWHDAPIVAVHVADAPPRAPAASRDEMIHALEFLIKAAPALGSAQQLLSALSSLKCRRLFVGFTAPAVHKIAHVQTVKRIVYTSKRSYCRNNSYDLDIVVPLLKERDPVIYYKHENMPRKLEVKIIDPVIASAAISKLAVCLTSSADFDLKLLRTRGLSAPKVPAPQSPSDDETESPFSVENMRLVFLGKRKPKPCDLG